MSTRHSLRSALEGYGLAVGAVAIATAYVRVVHPLVNDGVSAFFLAAVIVSAAVGGRGPGLFASILSVVAIDYFFLTSAQPLPTIVMADAVLLGLSGGAAWLTSSAVRRLRGRLTERPERAAPAETMSGFLSIDDREQEIAAMETIRSVGELRLIRGDGGRKPPPVS